MTLSRTVTISFLLLVSCAQDPAGDAGKPLDVYSPAWPQFCVEGWHDPRVMTIKRSGAGPARPAEYYVFELVDEGRRLRGLHKQTLRNEYEPWVEESLGRGRFLVTLGEIPGGGLTESCLVIYDFVRKVSVAWRQEDFLPADIREKWKHDLTAMVIRGMGWQGGTDWFDTERLLYYPNSPDDCREYGYPFLVVDLRSLSVKLATAPDHFSDEVVPARRSEATWRWSMGNAGEPEWSLPSLLPTYVLAVVEQNRYHPNKESVSSRDLRRWLAVVEQKYDPYDRIDRLTALGLVEGEPSHVKNRLDEMVLGWQTCFKLDVATGDYVMCPMSEWVERREGPEKR